MRTFSCTTYPAEGGVQSLILAADEARALELARRELLPPAQPVSLELRERGRVIWAGVARALPPKGRGRARPPV